MTQPTAARASRLITDSPAARASYQGLLLSRLHQHLPRQGLLSGPLLDFIETPHAKASCQGLLLSRLHRHLPRQRPLVSTPSTPTTPGPCLDSIHTSHARGPPLDSIDTPRRGLLSSRLLLHALRVVSNQPTPLREGIVLTQLHQYPSPTAALFCLVKAPSTAPTPGPGVGGDETRRGCGWRGRRWSRKEALTRGRRLSQVESRLATASSRLNRHPQRRTAGPVCPGYTPVKRV